MPKFNVKYVRWADASSNESTGFINWAVRRSPLELESVNRSTAYIEAYRYFTEQGIYVCVATHHAHNGKPLGFSDEELKIVYDADIPVNTDFISGVQIEKIAQVTTAD